MSPGLKLGWTFFALVCLGVAVYSLNRGFFVGSRMDTVVVGASGNISGYNVMVRRCYYLHITGIIERSQKGLEHETPCRVFDLP